MMIPLNHLVIFSQMHRHLDSFCLYLFISIVIDIGCFNYASDHGCFSVEHARAWPQNWMLFFSSETAMPGHQVNLESMRMVLYICPWWSAIVFQNHRDLFLWLRSLQFYLSSTLLIQPFRLGPGISCQAWPIPARVFWLGRCSIVFLYVFVEPLSPMKLWVHLSSIQNPCWWLQGAVLPRLEISWGYPKMDTLWWQNPIKHYFDTSFGQEYIGI